MIDLTQIAVALIGLATAVLTSVLVPWLRARYGAEQVKNAAEWVAVAIRMAEQTIRAKGSGEAKKDEVMAFLTSKNLKVDEAALSAMVEAAVFDLNKSLKGA
ncbi:MAG: phage holin family protein [Christensenellaceae bacterium]|jgi:hypothetical protein|nr:phage holin family protein [Christensenellaceae bacterium]